MNKAVSHNRSDEKKSETSQMEGRKRKVAARSEVSGISEGTSVQSKVTDMIRNSIQMKKAEEWQQMADRYSASQMKIKVNRTGLPDRLKSGVESLSGVSMDDVNVHYNSSKPSQLKAHAYAQGTDIHLAAGQEKHLPHEAWHVVQQKLGRVKPMIQMPGKLAVNDDMHLEREADEMGKRAVQLKNKKTTPLQFTGQGSFVIQKVKGEKNDPYEDTGSSPVWLPSVKDAVIVPGLAGCAAMKINVFQTIKDEKRLVASAIFHSEGKVERSKNAAIDINEEIKSRSEGLDGVISVNILVMYNGKYSQALDHSFIIGLIKQDLQNCEVREETIISKEDFIDVNMTGTEDEIMKHYEGKLRVEASEEVINYRKPKFMENKNKLVDNGAGKKKVDDWIKRWGETTSIEEVDKLIKEATNSSEKRKDKKKEEGACYLSTACCTHYGLPDNCEYLDTLRKFRDSWLLSQPAGEQKVMEYYQKAPGIVSAIERHEDKDEIYALIFRGIQLATGLIRNRKMQEAAFVYESLSRELQRLL